jgi:glycosyltransferase involved in cell wall biosynthesis
VIEPLRICLIASSRFPVCEPFMGGLEAHTHALAGALMRRGHRVSLFAAPGSDPALGVTSLPRADFVSSPAARADVASTPQAWMQEHHAYLDLMLGMAQGRHGPFDVVHNNSLHHLPVAMSRVIDVPVVTTLHTPPVAWLESAVAFADPQSRFVAVSGSVARAWSHVVDSVTIHNGIDTRWWRPGPGGAGAIWSGRIVPEKAPHEAIDAAVRAATSLQLAGPIHDRTYFDREIQPRLGGRVRYLGHLNRADLRRAVGAASVAVVTPEWDEPFGLVAAVAMACGTPVAAYDRGGLHEIIDHESGVLVPPGDVEALGAALRDAASLDRRGVRRRACRHFSLDRMVDRYETTYLTMAGLVGAA